MQFHDFRSDISGFSNRNGMRIPNEIPIEQSFAIESPLKLHRIRFNTQNFWNLTCWPPLCFSMAHLCGFRRQKRVDRVPSKGAGRRGEGRRPGQNGSCFWFGAESILFAFPSYLCSSSYLCFFFCGAMSIISAGGLVIDHFLGELPNGRLLCGGQS